jgi:tetratricopeptide (TPR) repeat protein
VLMARIDRLPEMAKRLLQAASVAGREAPRRLLDVVWSESGPIDPPLAELTRGEFVFERVGGEEPVYVFKHALIQEVAYQGLLTPQRQALHAAVGRGLEALYPVESNAALLAHHYRAAGVWDRALVHERRAAESAARVFAVEEALEHFSRALDVAAALGPSGERQTAELHLLRGRVAAQAGALERARADLERAGALARSAGDRGAEMRALTELGFLLAGARDYREGIARLESALVIAEEIGDVTEQARLLSRLGMMSANRLDFLRGRAQAERALTLARASGSPQALAQAMDSALTLASLLGDLRTIDELAPELAAIHRANGDLWYLQHALQKRVHVSGAAGRWAEALERLGEVMDINRRIGDRGNEPPFLAIEGWIHARRGELGAALRVGRRAVTIANELGHPEWLAYSSSRLALTLSEAYALSEARDHLERGLAAAERVGSPFHMIASGGLLAWVSSQLGDLERALPLAHRVQTLLDGLQMPAGSCPVHLTTAWLAVARLRVAGGEIEDAERLLAPLVAAMDSSASQEAAAETFLVLAHLRRARGAAAAEAAALRRAHQAATRFPGLLWEVHAGLAALCRRTADEATARDHQEAGRAILTRLAATLDEGAAREQFLAGALADLDRGGRVGQGDRTGSHTTTP